MSDGGITVAFIESLSPELLAVIPAGSPPPGITPNFDNPITLRPAILAVSVIFMLLAMSSYIVRVYMKVIVLKRWRWDDTMVTLGTIFTWIYLSGNITGSFYGFVGWHIWDVPLARVIGRANLDGIYVSLITITPALAFVKLSFLLQFYYLFKPLRWMRLLCWIGGSFIAFVYFGISIVALIMNSSWPGEDMLTAFLSAHRLLFVNFTIPTGVVGVFTDLFVLILPIPAVMGLHMALKKKLAILAVFALGILAVVGSTTCFYYRVILVKNADETQVDSGYLAGHIAIWAQVELLAGIIATNMPTVHQFFVRGEISTRLRSLLSRTSHGKSTARNTTFDTDIVLGAPGNMNTDMEAHIIVTKEYTVGSVDAPYRSTHPSRKSES